MSAGRPGDDDAPGLDDPPKDEARGGARPGDHGPGRDQEGGRLEGEPDDDHRSVIEARTAWIAALAAVLLAALFIPGPHDFPLDDAWIHLSYAKSVRLGDGPSYKPGDHELGFSSPLWVALLSVWPISGDPLRPVQLLGVLLHGLSAWIAARLGLRLARARASAERPQPLSSLTVLTGVLVLDVDAPTRSGEGSPIVGEDRALARAAIEGLGRDRLGEPGIAAGPQRASQLHLHDSAARW